MKAFLLSMGLVLTVAVWPATAQKDRKKKAESVSAAARLQEAEYYFAEGEKFFILGDYAKALLYFQRVHELNPANATVNFKIAEIYFKSSKPDDHLRAAASVERAIALDKNNKYFYLLASNIYAQLNQFDKAANALETLLREVKGTEEYLFELAALYRVSDRKEEALKTYGRADQALGVTETAAFQKIQLLLELKRIEEAEREASRFLEHFPEEERNVLAVAEIFSRQGQTDKAIRYAEAFLNKHPEAGSTRMLLAGFYRDSGQEAKARDLVAKLMSDASVEVGSKLLMLGTYHAFLNQQKQAGKNDVGLEAFVKDMALQLRQSHGGQAEVHLLCGDVFMTANQPRDASEEYRQAIRLGAASYEAWQNLLYIELQTNQLDSLLAHSEQALELFPNQGNVYYFNGYANFIKKRYREATYALEQAKRLSVNNKVFLQDINALLGDAYNATREFAKSDKAYEEVLAANPENDFVLNNYSYYLALRQEKLDQAEKMAALLVKRNPTNNTYLDTYAWVLYMAGKYKEARKTMELVMRSPETNATYHEHYGDILFKLGEEDKAVEQWRKAKSLGGDENLDKKIANRKIN